MSGWIERLGSLLTEPQTVTSHKLSHADARTSQPFPPDMPIPLTCGQRSIVAIATSQPERPELVQVHGVVSPAPDLTVLTNRLSGLLRDCPSLRSTLVGGPGPARQLTPSSCELIFAEVNGSASADARSVLSALVTLPFTPGDLPLRVVLLDDAAAAVRHLVLVVWHVFCDQYALEHLIVPRLRGQTVPTGMSPRQRVEFESSAPEQRRQQRCVDYWNRTLPALTDDEVGPVTATRRWGQRLDTQGLIPLLQRQARLLDCSVAAALFAVVARAQLGDAGGDWFSMLTISPRGRPSERHFVGTLAQVVPVHQTVGVGEPLRETTVTATQTITTALRHAYLDPDLAVRALRHRRPGPTNPWAGLRFVDIIPPASRNGPSDQAAITRVAADPTSPPDPFTLPPPRPASRGNTTSQLQVWVSDGQLSASHVWCHADPQGQTGVAPSAVLQRLQGQLLSLCFPDHAAPLKEPDE